MIPSRNEYRPNHVTPPGATLSETIKLNGMSQSELAIRAGLSEKHVNQIIRGKAPITQDTAVSLERVLGIDAIFWINRDARYQEHLARQRDDERLREHIDWIHNFPYRKMMQLGWMEPNREKLSILQSLLRFFGISAPDVLPDLQEGAVAFRKSRAYDADPFAVAAWLRKGWLEAQKVDCNPFDKKSFKETLQRIRSLTLLPPRELHDTLKQECAANGVALVFVPELPKTLTSGAARWLAKDKACIQLSLRYRKNDHFWFSFFHEAAHLVIHGKKELFITKATVKGVLDHKEQEADTFAEDILIPRANYNAFIDAGAFTLDSMQHFAEEIGIAPGIVVGRLQHDKAIPFSVGNNLKQTISWEHEAKTQDSF
jgi:HTH-type transcriptional regulator / antitoxin HigA